jgi:endonuclease YncB( thermonuclease family)
MQRRRLKGNQQWVRNILLAIGLVLAALYGKSGDRSSLDRATGDAVEGRPRLVDGDSFFMGKTEVRMKGIDAPEGRQMCQRNGRDWPCGEDAKRELQKLVGGQPVTCRVAEKDQHGRLLGYCTSGGRDLNAGMVASGYAVAFGDYETEERAARSAKRGVWSGEFQRPRDWRREHNSGS